MLVDEGKAQHPQRVVEEDSCCQYEHAEGKVFVVRDGDHFVSTFFISAIVEFPD